MSAGSDAADTAALLTDLQAEVVRHQHYLEGVVQMQLRLLETDSTELGALNPALAPLGQAAGADRVYIFEHDWRQGEWTGTTSQRAEWCAPGIEPQIDVPELQGIDFKGMFPVWYATLERGDPVVRQRSGYDSNEQEVLGPQGIQSLLVLPLLMDRQLTGFIGFDNCHAESLWTDAEVSLLRAAASQISLNLAQRRARRDLVQLNATLEERVQRRTMELAEKNAALQDALQTLQRAQVQLLQAEKLSGLGRMVAGVAHELRNPANYVGNSVRVVQERLESLHSGLLGIMDPADAANAEVVAWLQEQFAQARELMRNSEEGVGRIRSIVDSLVNFARLDEAERKPFDLAFLLDDTLRILAPKWPACAPVEKSIMGPLGIDGHPLKISQALMNLIDNAYYAAVEAQGAAGARVRVHVEMHGPMVCVDVLDNGRGVPAAVRDRIFDPFVTTKPVGTGTGMGLAIAWAAVAEHGGSLALLSSGPQGSCFRVSLPARRDAAP